MAKGRPTDAARISALEANVGEILSLLRGQQQSREPAKPVQQAATPAQKPSESGASKVHKILGKRTPKPQQEQETVLVTDTENRLEWVYPTPRRFDGTEFADRLRAVPVVNRKGVQSDSLVYLVPVTANGVCAKGTEELRELMKACRAPSQKKMYFNAFYLEGTHGKDDVHLPPRYTVEMDRITPEVSKLIEE